MQWNSNSGNNSYLELCYVVVMEICEVSDSCTALSRDIDCLACLAYQMLFSSVL